jgi:hypothetical protein
MVAARISECPMKAARLGPSGLASSARMYSSQLDADIAHRRRGAGGIEPASVAHDRVVAHHVIEQRADAGVNDIGEQITENVYFLG